MARSPLHFGPCARSLAGEPGGGDRAACSSAATRACEIDFEGRFWMDYDFAAAFGELARANGIVLSVHAPIAGFMGHAERGKKLNMAVGMLDHSAGIAKAAGAELVVFHPGFLLGRTREEAIDSVCEQLGELRERLEREGSRRAVRDRGDGPRARARLGSTTSSRSRAGSAGCGPCSTSRTCTRPPTARSRPVEPFADALAKADAVLEPGAPFHIHFSDIAFANRNETKHLPYGEGTLRAEPLRRGARAVRAAGDGDLGVARRGVVAGDPRDPRRVGPPLTESCKVVPKPSDTCRARPVASLAVNGRGGSPPSKGGCARAERRHLARWAAGSLASGSCSTPRSSRRTTCAGSTRRARRGRRLRDRPRVRRAVRAAADRGRPRHAALVAVDGGRADRGRGRRAARTSSTSGWSAPRWSTSPSASSGSTAASWSPPRTTRSEYTGMKIVRRGALPVGSESGLFDVRDRALRGEWREATSRLGDVRGHLGAVRDARALVRRRRARSARCAS